MMNTNTSLFREAKKHILIADDESDLREVLRNLLQGAFRNVSIVEAADGNEAAFKISREKFDLVILDLMMPKMRGEGVLQRLHALPRHLWPENIVVLSGNAEELASLDLPIKLRKLSKPCPVAVLLETVSAILEPAPVKGRELETAIGGALLEAVQKSFQFLPTAKLESATALERPKHCSLLLSWVTEDKKAQFSISLDANARKALDAAPDFPGPAAFARALLDDVQQRLTAKHIFGSSELEAVLTGPSHEIHLDPSGSKLLWRLQNSEVEVGIEVHFRTRALPKSA